jgi:hypothetical protein
MFSNCNKKQTFNQFFLWYSFIFSFEILYYFSYRKLIIHNTEGQQWDSFWMKSFIKNFIAFNRNDFQFWSHLFNNKKSFTLDFVWNEWELLIQKYILLCNEKREKIYFISRLMISNFKEIFNKRKSSFFLSKFFL